LPKQLREIRRIDERAACINAWTRIVTPRIRLVPDVPFVYPLVAAREAGGHHTSRSSKAPDVRVIAVGSRIVLDVVRNPVSLAPANSLVREQPQHAQSAPPRGLDHLDVLIGGGATRFQPVYVGDVADAVVRCIDDPTTAGRTYELGGPKIYTFRALIELLLAENRRKRFLIDIPFGLAALQAPLLSLLPNPPLTQDPVEMLQRDNVVSAGAQTLAMLGIAPTAVETILPTYLDRFRRGGWYARERTV